MEAYRWKLAVSALVIGAALSGCSSLQVADRPDSKFAGVPTRLANAAAQGVDVGTHLAGKARASLAAGQIADAIEWAEAAVIAAPRNGEHRAILGQAYLQSGRFSAAAVALTEAAELDALTGDAVVALALAHVGEGDSHSAVDLLANHADGLTSSDLGLALTLAGDHRGALYVLGQAVQQRDATAQTRQNYSLALAMAGRWAQSRLIASQDLPLDKVEKRMLEFSSIVSKVDKKDQIASLMGIKRLNDAPMPVGLALANFSAAPILTDAGVEAAPAAAGPVQVADAAPAYVEAAAMVADAAAEMVAAPSLRVAEADAPVAEPVAVAAAEAEPEFMAPTPHVAAMVAALDAEPVREAPMAQLAEAEAPAALDVGAMAAAFDAAPVPNSAVVAAGWSVQVGSLDSADNARLAWYDLTARHRETAHFAASTHRAQVSGRGYYRLTLDGFASKMDAQNMCNQLQRKGQDCFVRQNAVAAQPLWAVRAKGVAQFAMVDQQKLRLN